MDISIFQLRVASVSISTTQRSVWILPTVRKSWLVNPRPSIASLFTKLGTRGKHRYFAFAPVSDSFIIEPYRKDGLDNSLKI